MEGLPHTQKPQYHCQNYLRLHVSVYMYAQQVYDDILSNQELRGVYLKESTLIGLLFLMVELSADMFSFQGL